VLDLRLPDMTGIQVLSRLKLLAKAWPYRLPVMVVTGCCENAVMAAAFDEGACDYVSKPFQPDALLIRARSLIQRHQPTIFNEAPIQAGPIVLNLGTRQALLNGKEVLLSDKEFRLAWLLLQRQGEPVSRAQMQQVVWGRADRLGQSRSLDTHMGRIRTKLGLLRHPGIRLRAVYGVGYRLDVFS
jgi:DNA-binding response OmpR family regulator